MNLRIAAIGLMLMLAAPCAAWQEAHEAGLSAPVNGSVDVTGQLDALDAAWSMVESKKPAEPGKTIRRRGGPAKSDAASAGRNQPATGASWMRSVASLGAVVAVILFLAWGAKSLTRGGPMAGRAKRSGVIEIISRTTLSPRQSLCLVRVGQRMVLVGVTQDSLRTLDVIQDADAVAALAGEATASRTLDAQRAFRATLERETVNYEDPETNPAAGRSGMHDVRQRLSAALTRVKGAANQA